MTDVDTMIGEISLDKPLRIPGSATLREVAGLLEDARICVLAGGSPPRLVTDHDLAGALAAGLVPDAAVEQVATKSPVWATYGLTAVSNRFVKRAERATVGPRISPCRSPPRHLPGTCGALVRSRWVSERPRPGRCRDGEPCASCFPSRDPSVRCGPASP